MERNVRRTSSLLFSSLTTIVMLSSAAWCQAQPSGGASAAKSGTRIVTLGTRSGPQPDVNRAQSSNLLVVNGAQYVIDAGAGVTRRMIRLQTNFRNIDNIFITHPHSDHTGGLGALMGLIYDLRRTKLVNIYGPPGTEAGVQALLQFLTIGSEIRISDGSHSVPVGKVFAGHDVGVGTIFQDANVKVTAAENTHFHFKPGSPAYGKYKSYSYRFDAPDRSIVFTGDTGPSDAVTELAKGADVLVSEATDPVDEYKQAKIKSGEWQTMTQEEQAGLIRHHKEEHLVPEDLGTMAAHAGVKTVIMTHLQPAPNNDYGRYVELVKKSFSGQVLVAKDLMEF
jgi:ribonuclease BN (tRNA processing enzyme)